MYNGNPFVILSPGLVRVADPALLDYESTPHLQLIVAAIAGGKHAYAKLQVNLIDENDNAPKFAQTKYVSAIWENNKPQTYVTQVRAGVFTVCGLALCVCVCVRACVRACVRVCV